MDLMSPMPPKGPSSTRGARAVTGRGRTTPGARRQALRKGDRTSAAILDAAERMLATRSLADVGLDELAGAAGISRPTFYFHFESREAVLYALAARIADDLYGAAEVWLRRGDDSPAEAVRRSIEATVALWRAHGPVLRATVRARDTDAEMRLFWREVGDRFVTAVAEVIEHERERGLALPGPPTARRLAQALVAMNEQSCFAVSLSRPSAAADRELVDTLTTVWVRTVYGDAGGRAAHPPVEV
jgi:AcrR family transcriptional regulator